MLRGATGSSHSMASTSSFVGSEIVDQRYLLHRIRRTLHTLGEFPERERGGSPRSRPCCNLNIVRFAQCFVDLSASTRHNDRTPIQGLPSLPRPDVCGREVCLPSVVLDPPRASSGDISESNAPLM